MVESFGARLRQRREAQDIALIAVANQTKIKLSLLEGLERDEISQWPSGFYRRAFIRAYALAIGLNADDAVREFQDAFPEPSELDAPAPAPPRWTEEPLTDGGPPTRLRFLVGSAIDRLRRGRPADDRLAFNGAPAAGAVTTMPLEPGHVRPASVAAPADAEVDADLEIDVGVGAANDAPMPTDAIEPIDAMDVMIASEAIDETPDAAWPAACAPVTEAAGAGPDESGDFQPDLLAVAQLCTELGRVENTDQTQRVLAEAARLLNAVGLIVWVWDAPAAELRPALASGYPDKVLAQLPTVKRDADNPTAAAFRAEQPLEIDGHGRSHGALVIPLLAPACCAGVLTLELRPGSPRMAAFSRAAATIFAALLAQLVGGAPAAELEHPTFLPSARHG